MSRTKTITFTWPNLLFNTSVGRLFSEYWIRRRTETLVYVGTFVGRVSRTTTVVLRPQPGRKGYGNSNSGTLKIKDVLEPEKRKSGVLVSGREFVISDSSVILFSGCTNPQMISYLIIEIKCPDIYKSWYFYSL